MKRLILLGCLLLTATGCGGSKKVVPVSGRVMLDGAPLANAKVIFQPVATSESETAPASQAQTDGDGKFTLVLITTEKPGAVVGQHRVMISAPEGAPTDSSDDNPKAAKDKVPSVYNTATELTFTVPAEGTTSADFNLDSHAQAKKAASTSSKD